MKWKLPKKVFKRERKLVFHILVFFSIDVIVIVGWIPVSLSLSCFVYSWKLKIFRRIINSESFRGKWNRIANPAANQSELKEKTQTHTTRIGFVWRAQKTPLLYLSSIFGVCFLHCLCVNRDGSVINFQRFNINNGCSYSWLLSGQIEILKSFGPLQPAVTSYSISTIWCAVNGDVSFVRSSCVCSLEHILLICPHKTTIEGII